MLLHGRRFWDGKLGWRDEGVVKMCSSIRPLLLANLCNVDAVEKGPMGYVVFNTNTRNMSRFLKMTFCSRFLAIKLKRCSDSIGTNCRTTNITLNVSINYLQSGYTETDLGPVSVHTTC
jgi:hypothetical protein